MLNVAFILSSLLVLSSAIPIELVSENAQMAQGTHIALSKRAPFTAGGDGAINASLLVRHRASRIGNVQKRFDAYQRNTGRIHSLARSSSVTKRGTGADSLQDDSGNMWQGTITIGTPPQEFTVDFDTGSSDLFVASPWCTSNCDGHKAYHAEKSNTSKGLSKPFRLEYGDGSSVMGLQFEDVIGIAGLTAENQTMGSAFRYSDGFSKNQFLADGLMGLGFPSISDYHARPTFHTLVSQNKTDDAVFAFKLAKNGSELHLGGTKNGSYQGNFTYANVTEQGFWQVNMDAVHADGNQIVGNTSVIIDTGTTLIIGDAPAVKDIYASIPGSKEAPDVGAGMYTVPCDNIPDISLSFGGKVFNISRDTFNMGPLDSNSSKCVGGLVGGDEQDYWIVGDVFLQNVYTAFDVGLARVGFADLM